MAKLTLNDVADLTNFTTAETTINNNSAAIEVAMENTLSRDGTNPNTMGASLDMNSNRILNLPAPDSVNEPARLVDVVTNPTITVPPVGTSGAVVGLLSANKTDSGTNTFSGVNTFTQVPVFPSTTFWNNTRLAKTANYTLANADKFKTIGLGGNAYYTLTVGVASGFDVNYAVTITNEDSTVSGGNHTGRGKIMTINGYPSFILWPGQTFTLMNENNAWRFDYPGRWRAQGNITFFVNHASGNDGNDGLATGTGAFATIQAAVLACESYLDCNNFGPTIQNAAETFTENNVSHTHPLTGFHVISITGDTTTPANCVWQVSGSGNVAINCRDCGLAILTGFKFVSTGTGNFFINGGQDGVCDFGSLEFGSNTSGYNLYISSGGACNYFGGTMKVSGNAAGMILMSGDGHLLFDGATVNISTPVTIGSFLQASGPSYASLTSMVFTGSLVTGSQYLMSNGAQANVTGSTIPGTATGTIYAGAIVLPFVKTNDLAQTGDIGEYVESVIASGSAVSIVNGTAKTITSISLTAGDWDIDTSMYFLFPAATSVTQTIASISGTTNTLDTTSGKFASHSYTAFVPGNATSLSENIPPYRLSLSGTTTVFMIAQANFTVSTLTVYGLIRARRAR